MDGIVMKYIVLRGPGGETPVLFGRALTHRWVAAHFGGSANVLSAGFVRLDAARIACEGHSSSLGISARPEEDSLLVERHLGAAPPQDPGSPTTS